MDKNKNKLDIKSPTEKIYKVSSHFRQAINE